MELNEEKLISVIKPCIDRCRPGDWNHAKRVVRWVKELGDNRKDLSLLVTAGYIHDIGWRDLVGQEKLTAKKLFELESKANKNSEPNIREILDQLNLEESEIKNILRLVSAADKHESQGEDEAIIVDADQLSKFDINHLKEKYKKSEWQKMYELWARDSGKRIKTPKAIKLYPELLTSLKKLIS